MNPTIYHTLVLSKDSPDGRLLKFNPKNYLDSVFYQIDLSEKLMDGDSLISAGGCPNDVTLSVSNPTINTDKSFYVKIGGGVPNSISLILFSVKTKMGESWNFTVAIKNAVPAYTRSKASTSTCSSSNPPVAITAGFSAYQVAVAQGFTGNESQWLASLSGQGGDVTYTSVTADTITGSLKDCSILVDGNTAYPLKESLLSFANVDVFGADNTGEIDSTLAFMNACKASRIIFVGKGDYFILSKVIGPSNSLWIITGEVSNLELLPGSYIKVEDNWLDIYSGTLRLSGVKDYKGLAPDIEKGSKQVYAQNGVLMLA